jgi:hypothetical protein
MMIPVIGTPQKPPTLFLTMSPGFTEDLQLLVTIPPNIVDELTAVRLQEFHDKINFAAIIWGLMDRNDNTHNRFVTGPLEPNQVTGFHLTASR